MLRLPTRWVFCLKERERKDFFDNRNSVQGGNRCLGTASLKHNQKEDSMNQTPPTCPILLEVSNLLKQGSDHQRWQEFEKAEGFYVDAITLAKEQLGAEHQAVGYALNDLAQLQESMGEEIRARDTFVEALTILEKHLGNNHPVTLDIFGRLHHLYRH